MTELPLVLLHAFPLDARMWDPVRAPLAERFRVITPDQRGLGRSPLPETEAEPDLADAARDVVALLDKLELDQVVLGGCSMGGYLAMAVLRQAPERVGGLVLIDTKATADTPEAAQTRLDVADRAEAEGVKGWLADGNLPNLLADTASADVRARVRELIDAQPPSGVAWAARAMRNRPDSVDLLRETGVPALVIVGERDAITPLDAANTMVDALPDATLAVLPDVGHLTPLEDPAGVVEAILGWVN
ncbi:alpha/beta fold hydrolase [Amycolatopsis echigonensis]|uniref:Alpha/beta fold hydrolase n=1 Tax=Amycolatopsis echigonensis TaxID=2576905 RepID=A0A2N3WLX4_9PSEU|nr:MULTISPECIES: alpha/beta hydrolase [Amycolatopsis]MBB2501939.1 alpha/beta fold hydrolase [Amycolatopsis echigonensis]PKV94868.1 pimeloyl-ACP methyl ester carboxylesterase [Amycolatopsis niigatensis]